jgi:hypothetical protein
VELAKFIEDKGADKITIVAVDWLEGRLGADQTRLDRVLRRIVPPTAHAVRGTEETSRLFGDIESVPAFFLYDSSGRLVTQLGGPKDEQSRHHIDRALLEKVIAPPAR